ncbi:MAG TPA: hypothetical protein VMS17_24875 [Gemmataceae bacterium]|nr:hypothetical protein [Gemmataceae bacterium]
MSSPRTAVAVALVTLLPVWAAAADQTPLIRMGGGASPTAACRVAFTPDGKTVACISGGPVRLYEATSGKLLRSVKVDAKCLAFAPDGKTLAVGAADSVHIFNVASGDEILQFKAHPDGVLAVAYAPNGKTLATAGDDDHVVLWDAASGKEQSRLLLHEKEASVLAFSPNGQYLTAGGDGGALTVWRLEDDFQDERRRLVGRGGPIRYAAFLLDGGAFVWTQGRTIRVSEVETWVEIYCYDGGDMDAACFALSPDGKTLATGGQAVTLWDLETGNELLTLHDDKAEAAAIAFAPDGKTLAAAAPDGTVLIWDVKSLSRGRLEAEWRELGGGNAADVVHAVRAMKATPADSVAFLREQLKPPPPPDPRIPRLIADLDSDDFDVREKATRDLAKLGKAAEAEMRNTYEHKPSAEVRWRLELLLSRLTDSFSEETARIRAVSVLETIGTDEARQVLEETAKGPTDQRLSREAKAALQRMKAP